MRKSKIISQVLNAELNEKAARILERRAIEGLSPDYDKCLRAINFYRQAGLFSEALRCIERIQKIERNSDYLRCLHEILSSNNLARPEKCIEYGPRPFCIMQDVLPAKLIDQLLDKTVELAPSSHTSNVFKGYQPQIRNSLTIQESQFPEIAISYKKILNQLITESISVFKLAKGSRKAQKNIELQMNIYSDGCFYLPHVDINEKVKRKYTCVYYYHREPKNYTGGDLILFDDHPSDSLAQDLKSYTRLITKNNSLVIFDSDAWHQVTPVQVQDFENSRFSLTSWLYD